MAEVRGKPGVREDSRRSELIAAAQARWISTLTDLGGRNTLLYYKDRRAGTLDLAGAAAGAGNRSGSQWPAGAGDAKFTVIRRNPRVLSIPVSMPLVFRSASASSGLCRAAVPIFCWAAI